MEAGLSRLGTDFGNGVRDRLYFQVDHERERYLAAKRAVRAERHAVLARNAAELEVHGRVLEWIRATFRSEHGAHCPTGIPRDYAGLALLLQEDLTVLHRPAPGGEAAIAVNVSFPSGWRPERIVGATFPGIHAPVPDFAEADAQSRSMVASMVERGPYVRFVWTITADSHLDHHPEEGRRDPWRAGGPGYLRVERQVTVPFPEVSAALFLIRTYLYAFDALPPADRSTLAAALIAMPVDIRRYKGLEGPPIATALKLLTAGQRSPMT
jgi:hypothetical protein